MSYSRNSAVFHHTEGPKNKMLKTDPNSEMSMSVGPEEIPAPFISYTVRKTHVLFKIVLDRPFTKSCLSHSTLNVAAKYIPPIVILILRPADTGYTENICRTQKISSTLCEDEGHHQNNVQSSSWFVKMKAKQKYINAQFSIC